MKILNFLGTGIIWIILSFALVFLAVGAVLFYLFLGLVFGVIFLLGGIILLIGWLFFSHRKISHKKK